jgi:hypothetical protein
MGKDSSEESGVVAQGVLYAASAFSIISGFLLRDHGNSNLIAASVQWAEAIMRKIDGKLAE